MVTIKLSNIELKVNTTDVTWQMFSIPIKS